MSKFSGKCDFADTCEIFGAEKIINDSHVFSYGNIVPLKFESVEDLIPYYPYLTPIIAGTEIHLSQNSFVDEEENEILNGCLNDLKGYWRKCQRKKYPFNAEEAAQKVSFFYRPDGYETKLAERVSELGEKATVDGIHTPYHDYEREELYREMVNAGWDDDRSYRWCFGYDRWHDRVKKK